MPLLILFLVFYFRISKMYTQITSIYANHVPHNYKVVLRLFFVVVVVAMMMTEDEEEGKNIFFNYRK